VNLPTPQQARQDMVERWHAAWAGEWKFALGTTAVCVVLAAAASFFDPARAQTVLSLGVIPALGYGTIMFALTGAVVLHRFYMHLRRKK